YLFQTTGYFQACPDITSPLSALHTTFAETARTAEKIDTSSTHQLIDKIGLVRENRSVFTDLTKNLYADRVFHILII
ncbi:hypothetical protein, partial [Phocaeicola barnesiae]